MKNFRSNTERSSEMIFDKMKHFISHLVPSQDSQQHFSSRFLTNLKGHHSSIDPHTQATLMAFVDAVIPSTLGALDLRMDEFMMWTLDHFFSVHGEKGLKTVPLSTATAQMLDIAAIQLMVMGNIKQTPDPTTHPNGGAFAALAHEDRFQALDLLENLKVDLESLPLPFRNNGGLVQNIVNALHQMVMLGYYSEWFAFGSTRLASPDDRRLERELLTWELVKYPGPSLGYRELRGFLIDPRDPFAEEER